ncbi:transcription termination/antitermination NusG family protein (plasmid) [Erwinia pyri]|uniref:Transcription termination/antitermination NusG family protein n=1 Tax=Erwinia pyri TaxID=3062598 RepID=A0AA50DNK9_9GAMM|nr:transcription termination/antitermination NusG family protein [Erwinia sp. DE2]WLS81234.1 transcription termination/antitermination NusG family protein [Erwinia sp. DE2]
MKWYVLQFTATRYVAVFKHLESLNHSYYCPMITEKYRRPDKQLSFRERLVPLFSGYLFIQADFESCHSTTITSIPYLQRFIAFGGEPLPVPDNVVCNIQKAERNQLVYGESPELMEIMLMEEPRKRSIAMLNYITEKSLTHKMKRKQNDSDKKENLNKAQAST